MLRAVLQGDTIGPGRSRYRQVIEQARTERATTGGRRSADYHRPSGPSEGIGRPDGLKSHCPKGRAGSNPASGTAGAKRRSEDGGKKRGQKARARAEGGEGPATPSDRATRPTSRGIHHDWNSDERGVIGARPGGPRRRAPGQAQSSSTSSPVSAPKPTAQPPRNCRLDHRLTDLYSAASLTSRGTTARGLGCIEVAARTLVGSNPWLRGGSAVLQLFRALHES